MTYNHFPERLSNEKRKFKLYWKDGGIEIIEGRGANQAAALANAYRRVGYNSDTIVALTFWEEV